MYSGDILNMLDPSIVESISLDLADKKKLITVATEDKSLVLENISGIYVECDNVKAILDCFMAKNLPFHIVNGYKQIKVLDG